MIKFRNILLMLVWMLFMSATCTRNFIEIPVPAVYLPVSPYGFDPELMALGGYKIFPPPDGYAGIIVYHYTDDEFLAYDLACPNDYQHGCKVEYNSGALMLKCDCCGTTFSIFDGFPRNNNDRYPSPLHKYNTSIGPNRVVYIYN